MFTVYANVNADGALYIGMSLSKNRRLEQHRMGKSTATNGGDLNWRCYHYWTLPDFQTMSRLEKVLHRIQDRDGDTAVFSLIKKHPMYDGHLSNLVNQVTPSPADFIETCFPWNRSKLKLKRAKAKIAHYAVTGEVLDSTPINWSKVSMRYYHAAWLLSVNQQDATNGERSEALRIYEAQFSRIKRDVNMMDSSDEDVVAQLILLGPTKSLRSRRERFMSTVTSVKNHKLTALRKTNPGVARADLIVVVTPNEVKERLRSNRITLAAKEKVRHLSNVHKAAHHLISGPAQPQLPIECPELVQLIEDVTKIIDDPSVDKLSKKPFRAHLNGLQLHLKLLAAPPNQFTETNNALRSDLIARVQRSLLQKQ